MVSQLRELYKKSNKYRMYDEIIMLTEEALKYEGNAFAEIYQNNEIALSGGFRCGSSPAGYVRAAYSIIDVPTYHEKGAEAADVGLVKVFKSTKGIEGLVDIKIDKSSRRGGIGIAVIRGLIDTWEDHFVISDIKKPALGFWKKCGAVFYTRLGKEMTMAEARVYKGDSVMGVIFKQGSTTPVTDLVCFLKPKA